MNKTKHVKFSNFIEIKQIPSKYMEDRSMLKYMSNGFIFHNDEANYNIMQIINHISPHKIISINKEDIPFKIYSENSYWCNDNTAMMVLNKLLTSKLILGGFIHEFNNKVNAYIERGKSSSLEYISKLDGFKVKIMAVMRN